MWKKSIKKVVVCRGRSSLCENILSHTIVSELEIY